MNINVSTATRWGLNALILLGVVLALYLGRSIFIPTIMAVLLAAMLWPMVTWLNRPGIPLFGLKPRAYFPWLRICIWRLRLPWGVACLTMVGCLVLLALLITLGFSLSASKFVLDIGNDEKQAKLYKDFRLKIMSMSGVKSRPDGVLDLPPPDLPDGRTDLPAFGAAGTVGLAGSPFGQGPLLSAAAALQGKPGRPGDGADDAKPFADEKAPFFSEKDPYFPSKPGDSQVFQTIRAFFSKDNGTFITMVEGYLWSTSDFLWESILIMFVLLFLLIEGRMLTSHLVAIFGPSEAAKRRVVEALKDMADQIRAYLVWRTLINFCMSLILGLLYHALGLSQAWTWALLTAILWYVPYLGPIVAGFPPVVDAFLTCNPWVAVGILACYTVFVIVEGYVVVPVVMGRSMELNATTVMLACLFWQLVWGLSGLFLAMPLMAAVKAICTHVPEWQPWANLMGTREDPLPPKHETTVASESFLEDTQVLTGAELEAHLASRIAKSRARE